MGADTLTVAVVTGEHPFQEKPFDEVFASMDHAAFCRETLEDFVKDSRRDRYDCVVFYHFHQATPDPETAEELRRLTKRGQGIVLLHHAILAFGSWPEYGAWTGIVDRTFGYYPNQQVRLTVRDPDHPVTQGLSDWEMVDETYTTEDPGPDAHVLISTAHPKSMTALAWARNQGRSRIVCIQSGHDDRAYRAPEFRRLLENAIRWTAGL